MSPNPALQGRKILVVEDEWLIAQHLAMLLEDMGCAVVGPVGKVNQAIEKIAAETIDCALLDANLNGTSSSPIVDALVAAGLPLIIVTGYGALELPTDAMNAAPRLNKPFAEQELEAALQAVLGGNPG